MNPELLAKVKALQEQSKTEKVCINLDWLSIYYTHTGQLPEAIEEGTTIEISADTYLVAIDSPTPHFNSHMIVMHHGEESAHLLFNSKLERFFKKDAAKVEFVNHTLYSQTWQKIELELQAFGLKYKGCGRVDIAIDGLNSVHGLLNIYAKQTLENRTVLLKNSSKDRARFSAKVLNTETCNYENFNIGTQGGTTTAGKKSSGGNKMLTVYNKSLELVKSGKKYIQEYWLRNGIIRELQDLDAQAAEIEKREELGFDTFHLQGFQNIYRTEIRLKAGAVKEIEGFSLEMLTHSAGLASIFKLHCKNFFEPIFANDQNISRCDAIDLIPYARLQAQPLTKIARVEGDGIYKAKMLIHGIVQDIYRVRIAPARIPDTIQTIFDRVHQYRLAEYLQNKLEEWGRKYEKATPKEHVPAVLITINEIHKLLSGLLYESPQDDALDDLAKRHGQADPTADFGE